MESIAAEDNEFTQITHEISNLVEISIEITMIFSLISWVILSGSHQ